LQLADFLLVHERGIVKNMCLPSKIASYLYDDKPILICSSYDSSSSIFLGDYSYRIPPDDPRALATVVSEI